MWTCNYLTMMDDEGVRQRCRRAEDRHDIAAAPRGRTEESRGQDQRIRPGATRDALGRADGAATGGDDRDRRLDRGHIADGAAEIGRRIGDQYRELAGRI